jgi:peroxiredoxin
MVNLISCKHNNIKTGLHICIEGADKIPVILEKLSPDKIDTIIAVKTNKKGCVEISPENLKNCFYRLRIDNHNFIYLYLKENDKIIINSSYPEISRNYSISGSPDSELLEKMYRKLVTGSDSMNIMKEQIINAHYIPDYNVDSLQKIFSEIAGNIFIEEKSYLSNFIKENKESPVIYMALHQYVETSPVFTVERDPDIFDFVLENLKLYNPGLEQINLLESLISKQKSKSQHIDNQNINIKQGMVAPDFSINNFLNKTTTLSDFRDKNIIIYFWASWSKESTNNMEFLKDLAENHKKDVEIILFSLDSGPEKWKKSVSGLGIAELNNVCDFRIWESPVVKVYGIKNIPVSIIINKKGIIEDITSDTGKLKTIIDQLN